MTVFELQSFFAHCSILVARQVVLSLISQATASRFQSFFWVVASRSWSSGRMRFTAVFVPDWYLSSIRPGGDIGEEGRSAGFHQRHPTKSQSELLARGAINMQRRSFISAGHQWLRRKVWRADAKIPYISDANATTLSELTAYVMANWARRTGVKNAPT